MKKVLKVFAAIMVFGSVAMASLALAAVYSGSTNLPEPYRNFKEATYRMASLENMTMMANISVIRDGEFVLGGDGRREIDGVHHYAFQSFQMNEETVEVEAMRRDVARAMRIDDKYVSFKPGGLYHGEKR